MKMTPIVRWLSVASFVLVLCASASAAQSSSHAHKPAAHSRKSHPSHPMRNNRPKHHAMQATRTPLLAVRYSQPQQASSVVAANSSASKSASKSSGHSSPASSKKNKSSKKSRRSRREPTQKAPTPERISEIQSSLARGGYYQGEPKREVGLQHSCRNAEIPVRQWPRPQRQTRRDQPAKARSRIGHRRRLCAQDTNSRAGKVMLLDFAQRHRACHISTGRGAETGV